MSVDRRRVRALVRAELEKHLGAPSASAVPNLPDRRSRPDRTDRPKTSRAALVEIVVSPECTDDLDFPVRKACIIEPDRPCINSGYCKKLGY